MLRSNVPHINGINISFPGKQKHSQYCLMLITEHTVNDIPHKKHITRTSQDMQFSERLRESLKKYIYAFYACFFSFEEPFPSYTCHNRDEKSITALKDMFTSIIKIF